MLQSMRKGTQSWAFKGLLALLVASFAVWGVGDVFRGGVTSTVATVGDVEISDIEFSNAFQRTLQGASQGLGRQLDAETGRELGLVEATLADIVARTLLDIAARDMGLARSDRDIAEQIRRDPVFRNVTGVFDPAIFRQALATNGFSEEAFIHSLRRDAIRGQLIDAVAAGSAAPTALVDRLFSYRAERRVAKVLVVASESITTIDSPDEAALAAFHEENAERFTAPEYRRITYVTLRPDDLVAEIRVDNTEIEEAYEDRLDEFVVAERRTVEQLLYDSRERAEEAHALLGEGATFADTAAQTDSLNADNVSLGEVTHARLPIDAADAVFALARGGHSQPLQSPFGWHVFRVTDVAQGGTRGLDEVRDELARDIALGRAEEALFDLTTRIEDEFAGGASLSEAAARLDLELKRIAAVDARGQGADGKPMPDLPVSVEFVRAVFETAPGEEPVLRESSDGTYFMIEVEAVTPPALRPLSDIRDEVHLHWTAARKDDAAREVAKAILERLKLGEDFAAVAESHGLSVQTTEPQTRNAPDRERQVSRELLAELFALRVGEAAMAATPGRDGYGIARLTEIQAASPSDENRERFAAALSEAVARDVLAQYRASLEVDLGVDINRVALDSLF